MNPNVQLVRDYMSTHSCTDGYFSGMGKFRFTSGVKFVADTCGAYWLTDLIASWQPDIRKRHPAHADFQVWVLSEWPGRQGSAVIESWSDKPGLEHGSTRLARQEIGCTDFPADLLPFMLWVEGGVLILPCEH